VYGLLQTPENLITYKSKLKGAVLDKLHDAKIEIVSPSFMNQRQVGDQVFIPKKIVVKEEDVLPEERVFDKAITAESNEKLEEFTIRIKGLESDTLVKLKSATTEEDKEIFENRLVKIRLKLESLKKM